ncbi:hypothetical protein B0J14DRAFT_640144 [Halenospora varia]|nr:hypothetical protein B0J14DRAFT_640144 [Halenospora varia]
MEPSTSNAEVCPKFDFNGDIRILVTYDEVSVTGSVSSHAMVMAGPVWKKFIFPPFPQIEDTDDVNNSEPPPEENLQSTAAHDDAEITATNSEEDHEKNDTTSSLRLAPIPLKELDFREDDGPMLLLLLRNAHLTFNHIPARSLILDPYYKWQFCVICTIAWNLLAPG